ncbi:MAG: caspase family protein [gamma proteobacterium symbiont of Taylorina sp.]|nr:caspase family protein [gamma proteobacterium symbiont of Taylorina sp.]
MSHFNVNFIIQWQMLVLAGLVLCLWQSNAYATYPPTFSDCLYGDGEEYDQLDACQRLIRSNSKKYDLHIALGKTLEQRKKLPQAVKAYQNALLIFPDDKLLLQKLQAVQNKLPGNNKLHTTKKIKATKARKPTQLEKTAIIEKPAITSKSYKADRFVVKPKKPLIFREARTAINPEQKKFVEQLNLLKSLKEQDIISQSEYEQRKKSLLDQTFNINSSPAASYEVSRKKLQTELEISNKVLKSLNYGNYYALIIGNNQYKHLKQLKTAVNDAESLADVLQRNYGFKVKLLLNANRYETLKAIGEFRNTLMKNDNLLIYYAGHGVLDKASERGYWLPVDAERDFTSNWISTAEITDALKALQSWHVLVIADSCYSGTLVRSIAVKLTRPEEKVSLIKRLLEKKSRTVITSGGLEPVTDSGRDNHSVFSAALLDVLEDTSSVIEAEEVFSRIRDKVILNADQTPEYSNVRKTGHNGGDFIFLRQ